MTFHVFHFVGRRIAWRFDLHGRGLGHVPPGAGDGRWLFVGPVEIHIC